MSLSIFGQGQSVQTQGANTISIAGNTDGNSSSGAGTFVFAGGNNITLSAATAAGGETISIVGGAGATLSFWQPMSGYPAIRNLGQSSVQIAPAQLAANLSVSAMMAELSQTMSTSSNSSHAGTLSIYLGVYTLNGSTLSSASQGSVSYAWTNTSDNSTASVGLGLKQFSLPINIVATPGNYWFAFMSKSAVANTGAGANIAFSNVGYIMGTSNSGSFLGSSNSRQNYWPGMGHWSAQTAALPGTINITDVINNGQKDAEAYVGWFANFSN